MNKRIILALILVLFLIPFHYPQAEVLNSRLQGKILLQVEAEGQAWYVNPEDEKRYFLGRPRDAFSIMRQLGQGISNRNLKKIPVALNSLSGLDSDNDGLPDSWEEALNTDPDRKDSDSDGFNDKEEFQNNYNPLSEDDLPIDRGFAEKNKGRIFLQVENNGEAWYVSPANGKRYFLGRPRDAFNLMRNLGLGIKNESLQEIPKEDGIEFLSSTSQVLSDEEINYDLRELEKSIHDSINKKRKEWGLNGLDWNSEVARVARMHSQDLKEENLELTSGGDSCDFPLIHHEGVEFGLYNEDRLHDQGVYYFSQSGENIALVSTVISTFYITEQEEANGDTFSQCKEIRGDLNSEFRTSLKEAESEKNKTNIINQEIKKRQDIFDSMETVDIEEQTMKRKSELVHDIVDGWINSPSHRKNILYTDFNEAGIGVANINGYIIATQSFIRRTNCGYKGGSCCEKTGYYPYCYTPWQCQEGSCVSASTQN